MFCEDLSSLTKSFICGKNPLGPLWAQFFVVFELVCTVCKRSGWTTVPTQQTISWSEYVRPRYSQKLHQTKWLYWWTSLEDIFAPQARIVGIVLSSCSFCIKDMRNFILVLLAKIKLDPILEAHAQKLKMLHLHVSYI
jgi:hypothetical protein